MKQDRSRLVRILSYPLCFIFGLGIGIVLEQMKTAFKIISVSTAVLDVKSLSASACLGKQLVILSALERNDSEFARAVAEREVNGHLIVLDSAKSRGCLTDQQIRLYEAAKKYRRDHPYKTTSKEVDEKVKSIVDEN